MGNQITILNFFVLVIEIEINFLVLVSFYHLVFKHGQTCIRNLLKKCYFINKFKRETSFKRHLHLIIVNLLKSIYLNKYTYLQVFQVACSSNNKIRNIYSIGSKLLCSDILTKIWSISIRFFKFDCDFCTDILSSLKH